MNGIARRFIAVVVLAATLTGLALVAAAPSAPAQSGCEVSNADQPLGSVETAMLAALNNYRRSRQLPLLEPSPTLRRAALWKSVNMAGGGPYDHADADGRYTFDRLEDCGYDFTGAAKGENLANISDGVALEREVAEILAAWRASPVHEEVQTNPDYRAIGIARASGGGSVWWTVTFGSVKDNEGEHGLTLAEVRLPAVEEDPCIPDAFSAECSPERWALWSGDPQAWAVQLEANAMPVTAENILLQTLYYRSDAGSLTSRELLVQLGVAP